LYASTNNEIYQTEWINVGYNGAMVIMEVIIKSSHAVGRHHGDIVDIKYGDTMGSNQ
jgi:hypothetical protein